MYIAAMYIGTMYIATHENSHWLRQHAQELYKPSPDKIPAQREEMD